MKRVKNLSFTIRLATLLILFMVQGVLFGCASNRELTFTRMVPGEISLKARGVQALAVSNFEGPGDSGKTLAELFTIKLVDGKYYRVVEREKLNSVVKEQALGMSGIIDERNVAKVGKILGVEAVVIGKASAYSVKDEPYTKMVMVRRATGTYRTECNNNGQCYRVENYEEVPAKENYHIRSGLVSLSYRVISVETGQALGGKTATESYRYDTGNPPSAGVFKGNMHEMGEAEVLASLAEKVVETLVGGIQPRRVSYQGVLETGGGMFGDKDVVRGIELISAGRMEDAIQHYESLVSRDSQNSAAYYNLGVAYGLVEDLDKAEKAWRAAEKIEPKPIYATAVGNIKKRREELKGLAEQAK